MVVQSRVRGAVPVFLNAARPRADRAFLLSSRWRCGPEALPIFAALCYDNHHSCRGEVTERLKVLASKASVRETVPWVRIPPSPPFLLRIVSGTASKGAGYSC